MKRLCYLIVVLLFLGSLQGCGGADSGTPKLKNPNDPKLKKLKSADKPKAGGDRQVGEPE